MRSSSGLLSLVLSIGLGCSVFAGRLHAAPPSAPRTVVYPPVKLRGYGLVAGIFAATEIDGQSAGALRIVCQNQAKAKLVQAKYLSDLQLLPGVEKRNGTSAVGIGDVPI